MTRPLTKNTAVLRANILPEDDFGQPPNPADPPLTPTDVHRINIYVFEHLCDPWTAAQKCGMSPAELVIYLDQPHIARFVRKARQAIHIHNFEAAALHTRHLLQGSTPEPTRLRAAATLLRAYTRPAPRPSAPRATADDPPPANATTPDRRRLNPQPTAQPAARPATQPPNQPTNQTTSQPATTAAAAASRASPSAAPAPIHAQPAAAPHNGQAPARAVSSPLTQRPT